LQRTSAADDFASSDRSWRKQGNNNATTKTFHAS
jgi:hypothetical protein